ncbi:hypothetical protein HYU92_02830 [Candidatus Curtissbacteria bacterium]|nr:hypothetical protein [Candidatus Curtissbacteria bacterium]
MESKRSTYIIAAISLLVIITAIYFLFIFQKKPKEIETDVASNEVKEVANLKTEERPYVTLTPTSDGVEIVISVENMASFDKIEYELIYLADNPQVPGQKLERGATGTDVNTKDAKFKKSILLGTASKKVRSPDQGITDGKLTMHMFKGETEYLSETKWDIMRVTGQTNSIHDSLGNITVSSLSLDKDYWVITADTVGIPKDDKFKSAKLPVYGIFSIPPKFLQNAKLEIKSDEDAKIYAYNHNDGQIEELESTFNEKNKTISAVISNFATFVVVSSQ